MDSVLDMPMGRDEKKAYQLEQILALFEEKGGVCKTGELTSLGIDYRRIQTFVDEGKIVKVKSGYFAGPPELYPEEALVSALFPDGVLTMESALFYHGYINERPGVWKIAINKNTSKSRFNLTYPTIVPYYTKPEVLTLGVAKTPVGNGFMKLYEKERLICDVLKYMDKVDKAVFREAVFSFINDSTKDIEKLMRYADERRVRDKVMNMIVAWLTDAEAEVAKAAIRNRGDGSRDSEPENPTYSELEITRTVPVVQESEPEPQEPSLSLQEDLPFQEEATAPIEPYVFEPLTDAEATEVLSEKLYNMLNSLSLNTQVEDFLTVYNILCNNNIYGRAIYQSMSDRFKNEGKTPDAKRFEFFSSQKDSRMMTDKWEKTLKKKGLNSPNLDECVGLILRFLEPVYESILKDEIFLSDWMPELKRFLD
ncbi:MAG: type IV toxin-antitoxin system AbiEi family antitoxin domain-containing protein [Lachnospiraceae bacterium]|nr:type IV toxin-antitoxin system AbiEi family antitoxin domain-containing protein [Lachnospiraceae bacterium]